MVVKILGGFAAVIAIFLIYVAMQNPEMNIAREVTIKTAPEIIFPHLNNSKKANDWMPWSEIDPSVKMTFSGPEQGVGATSSWESTGQMGVGNSVVVESIPNQSVKMLLIYTKPMEMSQLAEFSMRTTTEGTIVRWGVTGKNGFVSRIFCTFMNVDNVIGKEFEKGLSKLKTKIEAASSR